MPEHTNALIRLLGLLLMALNWAGGAHMRRWYRPDLKLMPLYGDSEYSVSIPSNWATNTMMKPSTIATNAGLMDFTRSGECG